MACIFAIINDFTKVVSVSYTTNFQQRLNQISTDFYNRGISLENYTARILETCCDDRCFVKYYVDDYRNKGYTIIDGKLPLVYKFKIEFSIEEKSVAVVAVNKRNDKIILGKFTNIETANKYLLFITVNNISNNLVFSICG